MPWAEAPQFASARETAVFVVPCQKCRGHTLHCRSPAIRHRKSASAVMVTGAPPGLRSGPIANH